MLEVMGVPPEIEAQHPTAVPRQSYPPAFRSNHGFQTVWSRLCLNAGASVETPEAWNLVLRQFLAWATRHNYMVWPAEVNRVDNNALRSFLMLRRRWITQYLDDILVLRDIQWNRVDRVVTEDRLGITVNSSIHCRNVAFEELKLLFEAHRWRPNLQTRTVGYDLGYRDWWRWIKVSETGITRVGFSAAGRERGIFWYSVVVPGHPDVPSGTPVEDFVLRELWDPVVRILRFKTMKRMSQF